MARRKKTLREKHYPLITELAAKGYKERSIARALNMDMKTWIRIKDEDEKALDALEEGRSVEHDTLVNALYVQATEKNNAAAAMFLLKCRHGYREQAPPPQETRIAIMQLPAPMKREDYMRTIEHDTPTIEDKSHEKDD